MSNLESVEPTSGNGAESVTPDANPPITAGMIAALPPVAHRDTQNALNLYLRLRNPSDMPQLLFEIAKRQTVIDQALVELNYVHFARFLPVPDNTALFVVTVFDHKFDDYILDFAEVLDEPFSAILSFMVDWPQSQKVSAAPQQFLDYVLKRNLPIDIFSAYPGVTVLQIREALAKAVPLATPVTT